MAKYGFPLIVLLASLAAQSVHADDEMMKMKPMTAASPAPAASAKPMSMGAKKMTAPASGAISAATAFTSNANLDMMGQAMPMSAGKAAPAGAGLPACPRGARPRPCIVQTRSV